MRRRSGFTLIELIMIIVILGILAAVAIPKYFDLQSQAKISAEKGVVGGIRSGIATYYANQCATATCNATTGWPASVGGAAGDCSVSNPCFGNVMSQSVTTNDWVAVSTSTFRGPYSKIGSAGLWTYNSTDGTFTCAGTCPN